MDKKKLRLRCLLLLAQGAKHAGRARAGEARGHARKGGSSAARGEWSRAFK